MRRPCVKLLVKEVQPIVSRTRLDQLPVAVIPLDNPAPLVGEYQRQHRIERSAFVATDTPTSVCLAMLLVARESSLDESVPVIGGGRKVVDLLPITCTISTTRDVHRKTPTSTSAKIIRLLHLDTSGIENNRYDNRREGVELDLSPELFYLRVDVNGSVKARLLVDFQEDSADLGGVDGSRAVGVGVLERAGG